MKILGFNFGGNNIPQTPVISADVNTTSDKNMAFSSPFVNIGKGDLTKPFVDINWTGQNGFVRFGSDNLYPQIINQMYYTSPLNGACIEFKKNAIIGGGYEIENGDKTNRGKLELYTFLKKNNIAKISKSIVRDWVMHERVAFFLYRDDKGNPIKIERVSPEKVRVDAHKEKAYVSQDWIRNQMEIVPIYNMLSKDKKSLIYFENETPGQDYYPIPMYSSSFNWCYLDGESSTLHKSNIQESIFPSIIIKRPKKWASREEAESFQESLTKKKGSSGAGFVWVLTSDNKETMPEIETVQTSGNDKLFSQTDERIDGRICIAHQIDPLIMGIRVSGKLGSGMEAQQSYITFEKNYVIPVRQEMEIIFNELMDIFDIKGTFVINNYQIIDGVIVDTTKNSDATGTENI